MPLFRGSKNATIVNGEVVATQADIAEALRDINIVATNVDGENTIGIVASIDDEIVTLANISGEITSLDSIKDDIVITADNVAKVTNFSDVYLGASNSNPETRTDGSSLVEGDLYFNTSLEEFRAWTGTEWYAAPPNTTSNVYIDRFSGDGQTTDFTVGIDPKNRDFVQIYIDGVYQQKNTYSLSNSVISFSEAPPLGLDNIEFVVIASVNIGETDAYLVNVEDSGDFYNGDDTESVLQEVGNTLNTKITETEAKNIFSASGDLSYDSATGTFSFTARTDSEVRNLFSAAGDLSYDNATGEFSVTTYKSADFDSDFGNKSSDDLSEGTSNLYYTDTRARNALSASGDLSYNSSTGEFSFTERTDSEVRGLVSASGDLSYDNATGTFSFSETDPIVGAINGIVKADGSGNISAAVAGTDYSDPSNTLVDSDIGSTVQAYDAETAKLDVEQTFTAEQTFNNNIVMANGKGIDFSATAGTGTSELLDDYEEGEWSPLIKTSNQDLVASQDKSEGRYTKIGSIVIARFYVQTDSITSGSGNVRINNLPFAPDTSTFFPFGNGSISFATGFGAKVPTNCKVGSEDIILYSTDGDSFGSLLYSDLVDATNSNRMEGFVVYEAA